MLGGNSVGVCEVVVIVGGVGDREKVGGMQAEDSDGELVRRSRSMVTISELSSFLEDSGS